ncbi:hypothetical protein CC2G_011102 [Coprinopsis cinerea AmutBmut pab1-1]|nr:hypothetical protein CC2G_011102 [Coprinopsis cinerea AmutBmut pab1-1]
MTITSIQFNPPLPLISRSSLLRSNLVHPDPQASLYKERDVSSALNSHAPLPYLQSSIFSPPAFQDRNTSPTSRTKNPIPHIHHTTPIPHPLQKTKKPKS